ncbi:response regulator [Methylobacterium nonmethylotrophicum]|uniref:Regulatory protein VirG n=1 Tax=Methylobacterium nonmethylotrophicum TaxID=1141884 RepID=A0A4Z0NG13_9HYPH|nr:response regulator [Methylobacterium nonmethylotrophicum]TGD94033.1 response regulator [Methylobacterium nonmethylotrophicum]
MPTIALVDDEADLRDALAEYLTERNLQVLTAGSAAEFRALAVREAIDVVVLDIAMPGETGLSLARWLTGQDGPPGIILATAAGSPLDRVVGLEAGVDDYLVKPYDPRELLARIRSVLRGRAHQGASRPARSSASVTGAAILRAGTYRLNLDSRQLLAPDDREIALTAAEFDLLKVFAERPNRVLPRSRLRDLAPANQDNENDRSIDVRITRLRRKLERDPERPALIRTVRGEGYMFVPPQDQD